MTLIWAWGGWAGALAQSAANDQPVRRGQEYYEQSRFDEAISLLQDLVDRGALSGPDLERARELLARSYVKKGYPARGQQVFKQILQQNPEYRPDPIRVPPDEAEVFTQALKEFEAERSGAAPPKPTPHPGTAPAPEPVGTQPAPPGSADAPIVPVTTPKKKSLFSRWYFWAGTALVGGAAVAALSGGGDEGGGTSSEDLPGFPPPPP